MSIKAESVPRVCELLVADGWKQNVALGIFFKEDEEGLLLRAALGPASLVLERKRRKTDAEVAADPLTLYRWDELGKETYSKIRLKRDIRRFMNRALNLKTEKSKDEEGENQ